VSSAPHTSVIATGWRNRLDPRPAFRRVSGSTAAIVQIVVAATGAYAFALVVLGHPAPLLAATVTVSSLGLVRDARPRRVFETVCGMIIGILVAEVLLLVAGSGWWQLGISLALTLVLARFLSPQASFAIAAALQSIIVIVIPAGAPFLRLADGVVGGIAALLVTALLPRNPLRAELRDGRAAFDAMAGVIATTVQALHRGDRLRAQRGLQKARALQPLVDDWRSSLESGQAIARIAPFLRRHRFELQRHRRVLDALDLAMRNLRVVARRADYLCDDGVSRPVAADLLAEIGRGAARIGDALYDIALEPEARESLSAVAAHLDPVALLPDASLGEHNLIAAMRPLIVDLLVAAGAPPDDARAAVPRI